MEESSRDDPQEQDEDINQAPEIEGPIFYQRDLAVLTELSMAALDIHEPYELYQRLLSMLQATCEATGAWLLRYNPEQECLVLVASHGEKGCYKTISSLLATQTRASESYAKPYTYVAKHTINDKNVLGIYLAHNHLFIGCILLYAINKEWLDQRHKSLATFMGNIAAYLISMNDLHYQEQQELLAEERYHIARDLHDGAVQNITYALQKIEFIQRSQEHHLTEQIKEDLQRIARILQESITDLRTLSTPTSIQQQTNMASQQTRLLLEGLNDLLQQNLNREEQAIRIEADLSALYTIPDYLAAPIFHLIQEALNNTRKHAHADHIRIQTAIRQENIEIKISDNGIGLPAHVLQDLAIPRQNKTERYEHIGLRAMKERIEEVGGILTIDSQAGKGTSIETSIPLNIQHLSTHQGTYQQKIASRRIQ